MLMFGLPCRLPCGRRSSGAFCISFGWCEDYGLIRKEPRKNAANLRKDITYP